MAVVTACNELPYPSLRKYPHLGSALVVFDIYVFFEFFSPGTKKDYSYRLEMGSPIDKLRLPLRVQRGAGNIDFPLSVYYSDCEEIEVHDISDIFQYSAQRFIAVGFLQVYQPYLLL